MTSPVRIVRAGSVGLDLALGGGFRFVRRTHSGDRESATVLIRGGPGTGKSVLAEDVALRLAASLGGDVLYVCVEVLPSEVIAQRVGFKNFDPTYLVDLSRPGTRSPQASRPHLLLGMRDVVPDADGVPDLGAVLLDLARIAGERGFDPKVVVVDSLSDGYGLGSAIPRPAVDGVCKLAIEQGWGLILIEEVADSSVSPWAFAVDTVLSLRLSPTKDDQVRRELLVTKHRFGPCEPGPHRLQIEPHRVRVIPPFSAYRNAVRDLSLPPVSKNRSLQIPVKYDQNWANFHVPNGEGRSLAVIGRDGTPNDILDKISSQVGTVDQEGKKAQGITIVFYLDETDLIPHTFDKDKLRRGTLQRAIDGEDWLEAAFDDISSFSSEISKVVVGPIGNHQVYENFRSIGRAIFYLFDILPQREFLVVAFGEHVHVSQAIRGSIPLDRWYVDKVKSDYAVSIPGEPSTIFFPKILGLRLG